MERLIEVEGLVKRYGTRAALDGVGFSVAAGEIVGLLGPNGAGKSTALSILATLLAADAGTARVAGHPLPDGARQARRCLGLVPQQVAVYPTLTARENLAFFARMHRLPEAAVRRATASGLEMAGLEARADEPVARFSIGMRRRLNLACGVLHQPRVLLLDEPTVGVDPQSRERIFEAVRTLASGGSAILYCTHDMHEAELLCDRVVLLDSGRVIAAGTTAEMVARTGMRPRLHLRTARALPDDWLATVAKAHVVERRAGAVVVEVDEAAAVPRVLEAATRLGGDLAELRFHGPDLSDVFLLLTGRALRDEEASA